MFSQYQDLISNFGSYAKNIFRKGYVSWLFNQMKHWGVLGWSLIGINFILQVAILVQSLLAPTTVSLVSIIAGFLGANLSLMCVVGISHRSPVQGWFGLTSAVAIAITAGISHNWATMLEQLIIYLPFLDIPCILLPSWNDNVKAETFDGVKDWVKYILFFGISWGVLYFIFSFTNDANLLFDTTGLALAMTGSLAMLNLKTEQYVFWLAGNGMSIALFISSMMQGTATLALGVSYTLFFVNSLYGLIAWAKEAKQINALKKAKQI